MSNRYMPDNLELNGVIPDHGASEEQSSLLGAPYEGYRLGPSPQMSYQHSPEPSPPFTPRPTESPEPAPLLTPPHTWNLEPDTSSAHFLRSDTRSLGISTSPRRKQQYLVLGSVFPTAAAIVELLMLVYFIDVYLSLPQTKSDGRLRISH